jgi:hypothetical protein
MSRRAKRIPRQSNRDKCTIKLSLIGLFLYPLPHLTSPHRVNELLAKLHHSRNTSKASLSLHQRMLAQNIPLERVALVDYLKQKLMSPSNKAIENPTVSLQINSLENIREVIQSGLVESAESITNVILSRLLVDITQSLVKSLL